MSLSKQEIYIGKNKNCEGLICIYNINQNISDILINPKKIEISSDKLIEIQTVNTNKVNNLLSKLYNEEAA